MATREIESRLKITATNQASAVIKTVQADIAGMQATYAKFTGVLAGAGVIGGFIESIRGVIQAGDELSKAQQKFGASTEFMSELRYGAALADVEVADLNTGLKKLSVLAADAAGGGKESGKVFASLGVDVRGAGGELKKLDDLLPEIAAKFERYEDGPAKAALAVALFGKSGANLIPMLNTLRETREEARQLGLVMSTDLARASEIANDNFTRLGKSTEAFKLLLAQDIVPTVARFTENLLAARVATGNVVSGLALMAEEGGNLRSLDRIAARIAEIEKKSKELSNPRFGNDPPFPFSLANPVDAVALGRLQQAKEFLQVMQRIKLVEKYSGDQFLDARDLKARQKLAAPIVDKSQERAGEDRFNAAVRQLQGEAAQVEATGNVYSDVSRKIVAGYYGKLSESQEGELKRLAAIAQQAKSLAEFRKESAEEQKAAAEASARAENAEIQRIESLKRKYVDLIDPLQKYRDQLEEIDDLEKRGKLNADQALEARWQVSEAMDSAFEKMKEVNTETKKSSSLFEELGPIGQRALENIFFEAESGKDILATVGRELEHLIIKLGVIKPASQALEGIISKAGASLGSSGGGGLWGWIEGLFGGGGAQQLSGPGAASGGIMAGGKKTIPHYASGGVHYSPGMFQAGERPEAIIPLENGGIPVNLKGGGGGGVTVNVINNAGAQVSTRKREDQGQITLDIIVEQIVGKMGGDIRRGTGLSRVLENQYGLSRVPGIGR